MYMLQCIYGCLYLRVRYIILDITYVRYNPISLFFRLYTDYPPIYSPRCHRDRLILTHLTQLKQSLAPLLR